MAGHRGVAAPHLTKGHLGLVPPQGCDLGSVGKQGITGRNKMKLPPEWEEGIREEILMEISFPKRKNM